MALPFVFKALHGAEDFFAGFCSQIERQRPAWPAAHACGIAETLAGAAPSFGGSFTAELHAEDVATQVGQSGSHAATRFSSCSSGGNSLHAHPQIRPQPHHAIQPARAVARGGAWTMASAPFKKKVGEACSMARFFGSPPWDGLRQR